MAARSQPNRMVGPFGPYLIDYFGFLVGVIRTFLTHWYLMLRTLLIWYLVRFWELRYLIFEAVVVREERWLGSKVGMVLVVVMMISFIEHIHNTTPHITTHARLLNGCQAFIAWLGPRNFDQARGLAK